MILYTNNEAQIVFFSLDEEEPYLRISDGHTRPVWYTPTRGGYKFVGGDKSIMLESRWNKGPRKDVGAPSSGTPYVESDSGDNVQGF